MLSNFDGGVTKSSKFYSLRVVKPTRYGVNIGATAFTGQVTNAFINQASTTGVSFSLSMDLFQNFLGRQTDNSLKKSGYAKQRAQLEKKAGLKNFENNIRKIYWALVANNERKKLLTRIVKLAEKQYYEA